MDNQTDPGFREASLQTAVEGGECAELHSMPVDSDGDETAVVASTIPTNSVEVDGASTNVHNVSDSGDPEISASQIDTETENPSSSDTVPLPRNAAAGQPSQNEQVITSIAVTLFLSRLFRIGLRPSRRTTSTPGNSNTASQRGSRNGTASNSNASAGQNNQNTQERTQQPRNRNTLPFYGREGIFMSYLFINCAVRYAHFFKSTARKLIEFFSLANALAMLSILIYINITFVKSGSDCLGHVKDILPQAGILRVQVTRNASLPMYKFFFVQESFADKFSAEVTPYSAVIKYSMPVTYQDLVNFSTLQKLQTKPRKIDRCMNVNEFKAMISGRWRNQCPVLKADYMAGLYDTFLRRLQFLIPDINLDLHSQENMVQKVDEDLFNYQAMEARYSPFEPSPVRDFYAIEYSEEFGYLRLSSETRSKLAIPTLVVNLNPERDECFAGPVKRFLLDMFLGYDDYVMSSIKKLGENGQSQGYLRNLVTGEYFRFVTVWVNYTWVVAFVAMIVFTLVVTVLLRYSYHLIFSFMVDLLHVLDMDVRLIFPAAPMLTIILALVGVEEVMTEFFHDSATAFYVILIVWIADQFDAICLHTVISRRYWIRFFYLYHYAFYLYHYRFNGQYSKLALLTSWLFIQHSMLYFIHHYELPAIQSQLALIQRRNTQRHARHDDNDRNGDSQPREENASASPSEIQNEREESPESSSRATTNTSQDSPNTLPSQSSAGTSVSAQNRSLKCARKALYWLKQRIAYLTQISKLNMRRLCLVAFVCIGLAVTSSVTIQSSLTRASRFEPDKIRELLPITVQY